MCSRNQISHDAINDTSLTTLSGSKTTQRGELSGTLAMALKSDTKFKRLLMRPISNGHIARTLSTADELLDSESETLNFHAVHHHPRAILK